MVGTLLTHVRFCSIGKIDEKLTIVKRCQRDSGYPQKFINKYGNTKVKEMEKKPAFPRIVFKDNEIAVMADIRLEVTKIRIYLAAKLIFLFQT